MIKKYKCDYCQEYYTLQEMDGQFVCPECFQQVDKKNCRIFTENQDQYDDQDNYDDQDQIDYQDQDDNQDQLSRQYSHYEQDYRDNQDQDDQYRY